MIIPQALQADVLALAHEGHPGVEQMLRHLRQCVWWPGMTAMVKEFVATCNVGCGAAVSRNSPPPMTVRDTPEKPWQHLACDYKGPIGGKFYYHVVIDTYTRWPEVDITTSTSMEKLYPALDKMFGRLGYPESITHDNGPPYDSSAWRQYARECGFQSRPCSPEHPEGNGIAERFMGILVKITHAALAEGLDPKVEVQKRLLNYRNTPHPSTGHSPSQLMMGRLLKTKIPSIIKVPQGKEHREAKEKDQRTKERRKVIFDQRKSARVIEIKTGDKVLLAQKKTTTQPPFDPKPFTVVETKGPQITAKRGDVTRVRNQSKFKLLKARPAYLRPQARKIRTQERFRVDDEDDDWYSLPNARQEGDREDHHQLQLVPQDQPEDQEAQNGNQGQEEEGDEGGPDRLVEE